MTDIIRGVALALWTITILTGVIMVILGHDPGDLGQVVAWVSAGLAVGEAANVGKRATWKAEANEADKIRRDS